MGSGLLGDSCGGRAKRPDRGLAGSDRDSAVDGIKGPVGIGACTVRAEVIYVEMFFQVDAVGGEGAGWRSLAGRECS